MTGPWGGPNADRGDSVELGRYSATEDRFAGSLCQQVLALRMDIDYRIGVNGRRNDPERSEGK